MKSLLITSLLLNKNKNNILLNNLNRFVLFYNKYFYSAKTTTLYSPLTQEKLKQIKTNNSLPSDNETIVDKLIEDFKTKNVLFNKNDSNKSKNNDSVNKFSLTDKLNDSKQKNQIDKKLDPSKKPTLEQLENVKHTMTQLIPEFLIKKHPYDPYSVDIIFENYFYDQPKITQGIGQYAWQLLLIRFKIHFKFSHAKLGILKITHDEQEGTVKIRWRIAGIRGAKAFFQPWKIRAWKVKESAKEQAEWVDGFSILYVRGDGLINKHRVQRVMTKKDEQGVLVKNEKIAQKNLNVNPTIYQNNNSK